MDIPDLTYWLLPNLPAPFVEAPACWPPEGQIGQVVRVQSSEAVMVQQQVVVAALVASEVSEEEVGRIPVVRIH